MSLDTLARFFGLTRGSLAGRAGLSPLLLERVDQGRQALPRSAALAITAVLPVPLGVVIAECKQFTDLGGPMLLRPHPPRLGDTFTPTALRPTIEP